MVVLSLLWFLFLALLLKDHLAYSKSENHRARARLTCPIAAISREASNRLISICVFNSDIVVRVDVDGSVAISLEDS